MKAIARAAIIALSLTSIAGAGLAWKTHAVGAQETRYLGRAKILLTQDRPREALEVLRLLPASSRNTQDDDLRQQMEVTALTRLGSGREIVAYYRRSPKAVLSNEDASMLAMRGMNQEDDHAAAEKIDAFWKPRAKHPEIWFAAVVDETMRSKGRKTAITLLRSRTFPGRADCGRLTRLALLTLDTDPAASWRYLNQALARDPHNPDVRSLRGQFLEAAGNPAAAHIEYLAAYAADPHNPGRCDDLAESYRRSGDYSYALTIWRSGLAQSPADYLCAKSLFWGKMLQPTDTDGKLPAVVGDVYPFALYLTKLGKKSFWDESAFEGTHAASLYLNSRQETLWLRVIDAIQSKHESQALYLLQTNPFHAESWAPALEDSLTAILSYRLNKTLAPAGGAPWRPAPADGEHPYFAALRKLSETARLSGGRTIPADMDKLLRGSEAFPAAFLAAGWRNAAIVLQGNQPVASGSPTYIAYGLTQAIRINTGDDAALAFAARQPVSPEMTLLISEMEISNGQTSVGMAGLCSLATQKSPVGFRAASLVANARLINGDYTSATDVIRSQPTLASAPLGKEMLAHIALARKDTAGAVQQYSDIQGSSTEALIFLSKEAARQGRTSDAVRLASQALKREPDDMDVRANLLDIQHGAKR